MAEIEIRTFEDLNKLDGWKITGRPVFLMGEGKLLLPLTHPDHQKAVWFSIRSIMKTDIGVQTPSIIVTNIPMLEMKATDIEGGNIG